MSLSDYHATTGNWRLQLQRNERKTRWVIATFIALYVAVGLLVDVFVLQSYYPSTSLTQCFYALVTFQAMPLATLIMLGIAAVSLWVTYTLQDKIMLLGTDSHRVTLETAGSAEEKQLFHVVEEMAVAAGLSMPPTVYIIEAPYMNAFASGTSERTALIAVTRGLLDKLPRAELQAVVAHELSHIRHHDIKLTMMVAVLSNLLLIVLDVLFYAMLFKRDRREDNRLFTVILILRYLLPLMTLVLALFLSRTRELMADAGCVELMRDNEPLARALLRIKADNTDHTVAYEKAYGETAHEQVRQASYLFDPSDLDPVKSLNSVFATHPSIERRLDALGFLSKKRNP